MGFRAVQRGRRKSGTWEAFGIDRVMRTIIALVKSATRPVLSVSLPPSRTCNTGARL